MWHDPDDRLQRAVERYEEGDASAARAALRALDREGVVSPRIDLYLGHCHLEADRPRAALRRYRRCLALRPEDVDAWIGIALCHGRLGQVGRAVRALEEAARLDPDREEVHCHLVHCHALLGQLRRAERHARKAMRQDPACPHVHRHLAVAYLLAGQPQPALDAWRRVLERDAEHPEADVGLGRCLAALGRRDEARTRYLEALRGDHAADGHAGLGELAWSEGRVEDAAAHYRNAAVRDPEHAEAHLRLAECLVEMGRLNEAWTAVEVLRPGWELPAGDAGRRHGDPEAAEVAARILRLQGRSAEGLRLLRRLVAALPDSVDARCRLGHYLLEAGRLPAAARSLRAAMRRERASGTSDAIPGTPARLLARALGRRGRRREAVAVLARAAHRDPDVGELWVDTAAALLACARAGAAERALLRGLGRQPASSALWAAAAELAMEAGRTEVARSRLRSALRRDPRNGQALALLTRWLASEGAWRRSANAARAAMRVLPHDHTVVKDYGQALLQLGRIREASLPLRRYVLAAPADPEGYRLLGRAMAAAGDARGARLQQRLERVVDAVL